MRSRLFSIVLLWLPAAAVIHAQQSPAKENDVAAIRHVAEIYMASDPQTLSTAFYAGASLYTAPNDAPLRTIPLAQYLENVAKGAASGAPKPKRSIDFIDRSGNVAVVKITSLSGDNRITDYLSLVRSNEGWKVVAKSFHVEKAPAASSPQATTPGTGDCSKSVVHAFDFMLGDWETVESAVPAAGPVTGTSKTEKVLDGCGIWEHRRAEQQGKELFDSHLLWEYDVTKNKLLLFFADNKGHAQVYEGKQENGEWSFYRERPGEKGETVLVRLTYKPRDKGFVQTAQRSLDNGTTWEAPRSLVFKPKTP